VDLENWFCGAGDLLFFAIVKQQIPRAAKLGFVS